MRGGKRDAASFTATGTGGTRTAVLGMALAAALLPACGEAGSGSGAGEWHAQIDTVGDTVVVRTVAGSEWGAVTLEPELRIGVLEGAEHEMFGEVAGLAVGPDGSVYAYDRQVPALRWYGPDGQYRGTLGREGSGPGEYRQSDGGLAVLSDGRVVLRDPGNGRFSLWGPDGAFLETWRGPTGMFTSIPLVADEDGGIFHYVFGSGITGPHVVRYGPDGAPGDTIPVPVPPVDRPTVRAQSEDGSATQTWGVPFTPRAVWAVTPRGEFVAGTSDRLRLDLYGSDGTVLRIIREAEGVPVSREERAAEEDRVRRAMRRLDPGWRWDGPPIPDGKPVVRELFAGEDGRIWVQLHQPGEPDPHQEFEPGPDGERPVPRFLEPVVFDVFEADGRYLGRVTAPRGLAVFPRPVFRGDAVWGIEQDELGVQYLVRYRLVR